MELHGKAILITGGCGFIGANLVRMLADKNCKLKVLDNLSEESHGGSGFFS